MSWLTAAIYDATLYAAERACLADWRSELLGGLRGNVLELGAGTGANLDYYPASVSSVTLVEPDRAMRHHLVRKSSLGAFGDRATLLPDASESLSVESGRFDVVVGTLVLCSVKDVERTLLEARRVLRLGGTLALIEHVGAKERTVRRRWQTWLEPVWSAVSGGCHLLRDPRVAIERAGFEPVRVEERELRGVPGFIKSAFVGTWKVG